MNIYSSENIEILAEKLACDIRDNSNRDIFASPVHRIIIPSLINKNWLNFELLKYNDVLFRTEYDTLSFSPYRLAKEIGIRGLDQTATEKDLFFEILAILSDSKIMSMPAMACVYEYIDDISRELRRVKTYQFAEKLSKIFLKYIDNNAALYNKNSSFDVIGRWNEYIKRNTEPYNLEETDWSETEKCEFIIYSQMIKSRLKNNSETNITRLSILREFDFSKAKKSETVKLYVFDYPYISKGFAETLKKMSEFIDINIYINPVNEKLLGSDNSIQKKYFENFENLGYEIINLNPASDPLCISKDGEPCDSTVGGQCVRTQSPTSAPNNVLSLFRSGEDRKTDQDKSFQILSCPGMDREAECVYNSVIKNLEEDPTLKPEDIGVILCDAASYFPAISAIFNRNRDKVPVNFTCGKPNAENSYISGIEKLVYLTQNIFTKESVRDFFENPCVQKKLRITNRQVKDFMEKADRLNIWGFFDEKHKNAYFGSENMSDMFTWSRNAKSLRLGKIMDKGEDIDYFRNITGEWENIFPKSLMVEYSVFFTAIEKVYRYNEYFRKNEKSESEDGIFIKPEEAVQTFREFISEFLLPESGEDSVKILIDQAFDDYIHQVAMRNYIPDFMEIFEYINMVAGRANYSKGTAFTGGVCIGKLFNIRLSSFRILYICGLNQGTFPGTDDTTSLDLSSGDPDRITKTEEDKYALYKLICSAKDKVYLTYNSFDREKDADMYMSGTLGEITEYIEKNITGKPFEIINMPLFGRSLAYYRNQNSVTDVTDVFINYYDSDHRLAEIDYNKTYLTDGVPDYPEIKAFDFTNNKETGILEITASDLVKYLLNPYEFALSSMKMRKDFDFVKDYVFEPIKIESLDINRIVSDCVNELIRERGSEINSEICVSRFGREIKGLELKYYNIFRKYEEEGLIPSGRGGEAYFNIMRDIVNNYLAENEDRNVRYLSNVYIGRLRDDRRAEYSFKPWKAVYEDAERQDDREYIFGLRDTEFTGMIPLIEETEFPEGKKEYCVINLKPGSKKEKYVFETKAFMLLLSASGYFENSIIKGRYICSDNDNIKTENYRFKEENNIQAVRNSLRELFRDMQSVKNVFDFMPYKPFTQLLEKKDEFSESVFDSMFLEKIKEDYDLSSFENHHLIKYLPYNFTLGENVLNRGIRKFSLIDNLIEADKTQKGKNKQ